jgi:hypothetical protein
MANREKVWDKPIDVPEKWIRDVDSNVLKGIIPRPRFHSFHQACLLTTAETSFLELPKGTKIKGVFPHGASYWTRTAQIQTEQPDGSELSFFLKVRVYIWKSLRPDN